ncbi:MAG: PAS domain S-box protein, partial [Desulfobaccales bacterium]
MRIRTRVKIGAALTFCILLGYGAAVLHLDRVMTDLAREARESNEIVNKITILRSLTQDYLLYRTERAQRQWSAIYAELLRLLDNSAYRTLQSEYGLGDAPQKLKNVGDTFSRLMAVPENPGAANPGTGTGGELQNRLTTQLLLATQELVTRFINLSETVNGELIATQRLTSFLDILALSVLALLLTGAMIFLQRSVVKPVLRLHDGAEIIGSGHLDHKLGIDSQDEIGELSRAFDRMTGNLQQRTEDLAKTIAQLEEEIGERQKVEEALRKQAALIDLAHDAIIVRDLDSRVASWSRGAEATYGFTAAQALGQITHSLLQTRFPVSREEVDQSLVQQGHWDGELIHTRADGATIVVASRQVLRRDEAGSPAAILEINRDITAHRKADMEIRKQAALIDLSYDAIMVWDLDSGVVFWSRGAEETYGFTAEQVLGHVTHDLFRTRFPVSLEEAYGEVMQHGRWSGELVHTRADGTTIVVVSRWALQRNDRGEPVAILEINRDITEEKQAEEAIRAASAYARSLIEASLDPLVTISPAGKITDVNQATEAATGIDRARLVGTDFSDYFTEPDKAREGYRQVFSQGLVVDYPLTLRHASGRLMEVVYNAAIYRNEAGEVQGVFAAARDITER